MAGKREESGRTYRGKAAGDRSAERRARFLDAGLELFGTQGFASTTVKGLCTEAGLTERYFYESFENRENLFTEVAAHCVAGLMARLVAARAEAGDDRERFTRSMLEVFFRWFEQDPRRARIQLVEPLVMGPAFHTLYRDVTAMFVAMLQDTTTRHYDASLRARGVDSDLLATALVGAAIEIVKEWVLGGYRQSLEEMIRTTSFLFDSLAEALERAERKGRPTPSA